MEALSPNPKDIDPASRALTLNGNLCGQPLQSSSPGKAGAKMGSSLTIQKTPRRESEFNSESRGHRTDFPTEGKK
jgi:hypothetical protein